MLLFHKLSLAKPPPSSSSHPLSCHRDSQPSVSCGGKVPSLASYASRVPIEENPHSSSSNVLRPLAASHASSMSAPLRMCVCTQKENTLCSRSGVSNKLYIYIHFPMNIQAWKGPWGGLPTLCQHLSDTKRLSAPKLVHNHEYHSNIVLFVVRAQVAS